MNGCASEGSDNLPCTLNDEYAALLVPLEKPATHFSGRQTTSLLILHWGVETRHWEYRGGCQISVVSFNILTDKLFMVSSNWQIPAVHIYTTNNETLSL